MEYCQVVPDDMAQYNQMGRPGAPRMRHPNYKSKLCKRMQLEGGCIYTSTCGFAHGAVTPAARVHLGPRNDPCLTTR